jgi:hypothetical protein
MLLRYTVMRLVKKKKIEYEYEIPGIIEEYAGYYGVSADYIVENWVKNTLSLSLKKKIMSVPDLFTSLQEFRLDEDKRQMVLQNQQYFLSQQERRAAENNYVYARIYKNIDMLLDSALSLAQGVYIQDKEEKVYLREPNGDMIKYLIDRGFGRPVPAGGIGEGEGGGTQVNIYLPDNQRGDSGLKPVIEGRFKD